MKRRFGADFISFFVSERPWLHDNLDEWISRISVGPKYKCVAIFCDNSGADIILGILPFARELLKAGSKVCILLSLLLIALCKKKYWFVDMWREIILMKTNAWICESELASFTNFLF